MSDTYKGYSSNYNGIEDPSEIDEDELQRQLEEELAKIHNDGNDDFEKSSTYSIFNQSHTSGFNFNSSTNNNNRPKLTEDNMDDYLEKLLQKERDKYREANRDFLENNEAMKGLREMQDQQMHDLIKEEWNQDLEDLKELNKVDINQFVNKMPEEE